ncbi:MAG: glutamate 5-kinase, partial [Planctomycetota bacterium]
AIGQAQLMHHWQAAAAGHGLAVAQVLLTADDFGVRERYLNLLATFRSLFEYGAVPVINENDPVAVAELTVGDNDQLSGVVAAQLQARHLILLTDIDGVYDRDPRLHADACRVSELRRIEQATIDQAGEAGARGRGGMRSKLMAARLAAHAGVDTVIAHAREPRIVTRLLDGEALGTRIPASDGAIGGSRRRWLAYARRCQGSVRVDAGAARALLQSGRSLLPVGVTAVEGAFKRGDTVAIHDPHGREIARGLAGLAADELRCIAGKRLDVAARELGYALPKTAVHRDNLMVVV